MKLCADFCSVTVGIHFRPLQPLILHVFNNGDTDDQINGFHARTKHSRLKSIQLRPWIAFPANHHLGQPPKSRAVERGQSVQRTATGTNSLHAKKPSYTLPPNLLFGTNRIGRGLTVFVWGRSGLLLRI